MNHFKFEDIQIEEEITFQYELNEEKMQKFREITGDLNPLHTDLTYAKSKGFKENVVYGMLTSSVLSSLAGMYMPGEYSIIHSVEVNFVHPVFLSDCPLTVTAKVVNKEQRFKQITLKYQMHNTSGQKVCRGTMKIGFVEY